MANANGRRVDTWMTGPDPQYTVPPANENRLSDVLAALISTDPGPIAQFIGPDQKRCERARERLATAVGADICDLEAAATSGA